MMRRNLKKITETASTLEKMMTLLMVPLLMMNQMWYMNRNGWNLLKLRFPPRAWWKTEFQEVPPIPVHIPHLVHHQERNHQQGHHLLQSGCGLGYFLEIPPHHQLVVM